MVRIFIITNPALSHPNPPRCQIQPKLTANMPHWIGTQYIIAIGVYRPPSAGVPPRFFSHHMTRRIQRIRCNLSAIGVPNERSSKPSVQNCN